MNTLGMFYVQKFDMFFMDLLIDGLFSCVVIGLLSFYFLFSNIAFLFDYFFVFHILMFSDTRCC